MQLFVISISPDIGPPSELAAALLDAAQPYRHLDPNTLLTEASQSGVVKLAAVAHGSHQAEPRRYRAKRGNSVVLYDGFPVEPFGRYPAWDAESLLEHWQHVGPTLEGQFSAVRVDVEADRVECTSDTFGLGPLYAERLGRGWLIGNSVEAIRRISHASEPDPLGVASFLTLGWAVGDRTLVSSIRALPGGR